MNIAEILAAEFPALDMDHEIAYFLSRIGKQAIPEAYLPAFRRHLASRVVLVTGAEAPKFQEALYGGASRLDRAADRQNDGE